MSSRRILFLAILSFGILCLALPRFRAALACGLFYPECNPLIPVQAAPDWQVPSTAEERRAYDFVHSLPLPPGTKTGTPFDFKSARLVTLAGGKTVAQQYFEHLCETEAGEFINTRVRDVPGFKIMRPRGIMVGSDLDRERYLPEEPVGFAWFGDDSQFTTTTDYVGLDYVQPPAQYQFVELAEPGSSKTVALIARTGDSGRYPNGRSAAIARWGPFYKVPYVISRKSGQPSRARYGYTWRGIRRARDREFGIAGSEFLVVDLSNGKVLGAKREFKSTYSPSNPNATHWSAARSCTPLSRLAPVRNFIRRVLKPSLEVNDAYIAPEQLETFHQQLQRILDDRIED